MNNYKPSFFNDPGIVLIKGIFCLYFTAFFIHYFTNITIVLSIVLFSLTAMFGLIYIWKNVREREISTFVFILLITDLFAVIAVLYNGNHTIADVIKLLAYHLVAIILFERKDQMFFFRKISIILFWILAVKTVIAFINSNADLDFYISERIGSNTVSILALFFFSIDTIWRLNDNKKVNYFYCLMTVVVSFFSRGIAGILTTVILFIMILLFGLEKKVVTKMRYCFLVFSIIVFIILLSTPIMQVIIDFIGHGDIATRFLMWESYFDLVKVSIPNILFGANISQNYLLNYYKNLHNTFLNWHYYYGLIPFAFFLYITIRENIYFIKEKKYFIISILFSSFLRSMTDEATYAYMIVWIYLFCEAKYTIGRESEINN